MDYSSPIVIGFVASFFLLAVLAMTSFVKISVVFLIVRNAMGLQQVPANAVLMALALFISLFISLPVISEATTAITESEVNLVTPEDLISLWQIAIAPFQEFLLKNIDEEQLMFFVDVSNEIWKDSGLTGTRDDLIIQLPTFMLTELTEAFEIGFLLYLPFVAIDLAVTGILMALGMQQVQPNVISVPFKLLIFVLVNGWAKLIEGLILTYSG